MNPPPKEEEGYLPDDQNARNPQDYIRWFIRRFWVLLITVVGGFLFGLYFYSSTPPTYRSSTTIEIVRFKTADEIDEKERMNMSSSALMLSSVEKLTLLDYYVATAKGHLFANRDDILPQKFRFPWQPEERYSSSELPPQVVAANMREWVDVKWRPSTN